MEAKGDSWIGDGGPTPFGFVREGSTEERLNVVPVALYGFVFEDEEPVESKSDRA